MPICRGVPGVGAALPRAEWPFSLTLVAVLPHAEWPFSLTLVAVPGLRHEYRVR